MKSIVFFNNKGGVGKTTLLCNLAAYLVLEARKKVLVIDADPQCNSTSYVIEDDLTDEIYSKNKRQTIDHFIQPTVRGKGDSLEKIKPLHSSRFGFDIIPGDPRLAIAEDVLATDWKDATSGHERGLQTTFVFKTMSNLYSDYDYIFFDVGPSLGAINRAILVGSDFFVVPMSVDVFSLMAIDNIELSLSKWKSSLERGMEDYERDEGRKYIINGIEQTWNLQFCGYVMQQYLAKTIKGQKVHVKAYEKISKDIPSKIQAKMVKNFVKNTKSISIPLLGEIENLYSLIPMSQTSKAPIFALKAKDGVVGAHFAKVSAAKEIYARIAESLEVNIESLS